MNKSFIKKITRRNFLKTGSFAALSYFFPEPLFASIQSILSQERSLAFYNTHTREYCNAVYWSNGQYMKEALKKIDYILRDHRAEKIKPINTRLLNFLTVMNASIGTKHPFHIISGYRSPETNGLLRQKSKGVARYSYHMFGKAVDIRIPGLTLSRLREIAVNLKTGGVGYYPGSDFIHVDLGPVRYWQGS